MRLRDLAFGLVLVAALAAFLAYYAQYHNPFINQPSPFWSAFFLIFIVLIAFIAIVRYFTKI